MVFFQSIKCAAECINRAFKALQQIRCHQCNQAFFPVYLTQLASTAFNLRVVHLFILRQAARQDVADGGIYGELEQRQLLENLVEAHYIRSLLSTHNQWATKRQGLAPLRELPDIRGVVEGLNVFARACDRDAVEQLEEIEVERVQDGTSRAFLRWKF
ncbi:hypothetical protein D3C72_1692250 [compost metagenome]